MIKIELNISVEKTEPEEIIDRIVDVCKRNGIAYIADKEWKQVMVLFGYGLAVFYLDKNRTADSFYTEITIIPIAENTTLSSIMIDILKLLKELGLNYENMHFTITFLKH
jgi:hypothetical protein